MQPMDRAQKANVSLPRLGTVARTDSRRSVDEISRVAVSVTMWFIIESQTSIIAACLPTLAPLFRSSQYAGFKVQMRRPMPVLRPIRLRGTTKSSKVDSTHIEQGSKDDRRPWEHMNSDSSHEGDVASDSNAELTVVDIV